MRVSGIIKLIGIIMIFVGIVSAISGQFHVPLNFILPILEFLNYPSIATVIPSGLLLAICPELLSKRINSDLMVSMFTISLLLSSVFGWEALWHYVFPDYFNNILLYLDISPNTSRTYASSLLAPRLSTLFFFSICSSVSQLNTCQF